MAPFLTQLKVLLWRNFLVKRRGWKRTVLEVFIPVLLVVVMILINLGVHSNTIPSIDKFSPQNVSNSIFEPSKQILISPSLSFTQKIVDYLNGSAGVRLVANVSEMDNEYAANPQTVAAGVQFLWSNTSQGVSVYGYVLRIPYLSVEEVVPGCSYRHSVQKCSKYGDRLTAECPGSQSLVSGLLALQWSVEMALLQALNPSEFRPPAIQAQMMSLPAFRPGVTNFQLLVCMCMVIALAPLTYFITFTLVMEKKSPNKVIWKVLRTSDMAFWISWGLTYLVTVLALSVLSTILVAVAGFFSNSGLGYFFLLVFLYSISLLGISFIVSVFFNNTKISGLVASIISILLGLLYLPVSLTRSSTFSNYYVIQWESGLPFSAQLILSLFSPMAFALGLDQVAFYQKEGLDYNVTTGQYPLIASILMLVVDIVLYGVLAVYFSSVVPSKFRHSRKPWFCLAPSFWRDDHGGHPEDVTAMSTPEGPHIEPVTEDVASKATIRIRDLSKLFSGGKKEHIYGLNGLDLDIFEGQVTCILGHHGAGKTTLMNILAGVMPPSCGTAFIKALHAYSTSDHLSTDSAVAFCTQHDMILGPLRVEEQMYIAAILKGIAKDNVEQVISCGLSEMHLENERHKMVQELSGCQKRRLSLALTLLTNPKVLLLDEPTLGMDPEERRYLWKWMHARKSGRAILFTSCHMEEADYFADRKVVLSSGRIRCAGSSNFLKEQFDVGYRLEVILRPATSTTRLLQVVQSQVRGANLVRCEDNKLTISIPQQHSSKLTALFRKLESKDLLGVLHFGISMTTLQQVFLKLESQAVETEKKPTRHLSAEEEEAGQVFVSPLLTPPQHAESEDNKINDSHKAPMSKSKLPRSKTVSNLEGLAHFPQTVSKARSFENSRNRSVSSRLSSLRETNQEHDCEKGEPQSKTKIVRTCSFLIDKLPQQRKSRGRASDLISKTPRAKSFVTGSMNRSHTLTNLAECDEGIEEKPVFDGITMPTSSEDRRARVAAFNGMRSFSSENLQGLLRDDISPTLSSPLVRLNVLETFDWKSRSPAVSENERSSVSELPSVSSSEEIPFSQGDNDFAKPSENVQIPVKVGEVLAQLRPTQKGPRLALKRLFAMLKLRTLVCLQDKCSLLLRVMVPLVLTFIAIGLTYAIPSLKQTSLNPEINTYSLAANNVVYRNQSGESLESLLANFSRALVDSQLISEYTADHFQSSFNLESLLGILKSDGSEYQLYYNASCALALPQLVSVISHVMKNSSPSLVLTDTTYLASNMSVWLQPWPPQQWSEERGTFDWIPILLLGVALLFPATIFAVRMLIDRKKNIRRYLGMAGVGRLLYYGSAFIVDVIEFCVPAILLVVFCSVSEMGMFEDEGARDSLFLLVILSVPVGVLWAYTASFVFQHPKTCRYFMTSCVILISVSLACLVHFLDHDDTAVTAETLHYVFSVLWPPYIRFGGLHYISQAGIEGKHDPRHNFFEFTSNVDICFVMLVLDLIVLSCLIFLFDKMTYKPPSCCCSIHRVPNPISCRDDSVEKEAHLIQNLKKNGSEGNWPLLVVEGLSKAFTHNRQQTVAVNHATFTVNRGDVLGLLGPHGAGKTSVLNSLMGLYPSSGGVVHLESHQVDFSKQTQLSEKVGYCPDYNPLWDCLTVDQHINLLGGIRGVHRVDLDRFKSSLYHDMDLKNIQSWKIKELSESDKRRLTFAMSMLGKQTMMFVDKPSLGIEPRSRKPYWDAVNYFIKGSQRSAIVSTHNVDEAEVLCTRLAIMVNGQLRCLGTIDELKERCHNKYTLDLELREKTEEEVQRKMGMIRMFLHEFFSEMRLIEQFQHRAIFTVHLRNNPNFSLAGIFDLLETMKRLLELEDFTFSQFTLEQMFLELAQEQAEGESKYTSPGTGSTTKVVTSHVESAKPEILVSSTLVDVPDHASIWKDDQNDVGASCHDSDNDAYAAVGMVIVHDSGDDNGGGVAGVDRDDVGAAAPVVFTFDGIENLSYISDGEITPQEAQTSV